MPKALGQSVDEYGLSPAQRLFADTWLVCDNVTQAAMKAGYAAKSAHSQGSRLLKHGKVKAYLDQKRTAVVTKADKKFDITIDRVLLELSRIAFGDIRQIFDDKGQLKPVHELTDDVAAAIASIEVEERYSRDGVLEGYVRKIKKADKLKALDMLGRYLKMWESDKSGEKNVLNININMASDQVSQNRAKTIEHDHIGDVTEKVVTPAEPGFMAIVPDGA